MMRKIILSSILIISMLFCSSCSMLGSRIEMLNNDNDGEKADAQLEQVLEAIKNQDKDALRGMFSKQALDEAENLDGRMDYLFGFIQGDIESWETIVHGATNESINYGSVVKNSSSWYYVNTDKQKYLLFFLECIINTDHPENGGVYMLQVIKAEDKKAQFNGGGPGTRCAGIYKPDENTSSTSSVKP